MSNSALAWSSGNGDNDEFDEIVLESLTDMTEDDEGLECPACHGWGLEDKWDEDSPPCMRCCGEGYI